MNKPEYNEYTFEHPLIRDSVYIQDLEEYCDVLEKAFDKACTELDLSNKQLIALDNRFIRTTKEQWKEYLLEDDR